MLSLCGISSADKPELLGERTIAPEKHDQAEEQRYRDGLQKQTKELLSKIDLLENELNSLKRIVGNLSLGTVDSFYVIFSDSTSVQNGNKNVNAFLTPNDTLYIDTLETQ